MILPILACAAPAKTPELVTLSVLPIRNVALHLNDERQIQWTSLNGNPDIWVDTVVYEVNYSEIRQCALPKYISDDHLSAREVTYQTCVTLYRVTLTGWVSLYQSENYRLVYREPIFGQVAMPVYKARYEGDPSLVPEGIDLNQIREIPSFDSLLQAATQDVKRRRDRHIDEYYQKHRMRPIFVK